MAAALAAGVCHRNRIRPAQVWIASVVGVDSTGSGVKVLLGRLAVDMMVVVGTVVDVVEVDSVRAMGV